nr:outer membrane protein transport protein [Qipengyuania proteolytica]
MLVPASQAQATDGYFLHGVGAGAKGAGGVAIAMPQDAAAIATNPATATAIEHRLDIGVDVFIPDRGAEIESNAFGLDGQYSGNGANPFVLGDVAYVRPLSDRVSVGIALYANGGMNTVYKTNPLAPFGAPQAGGVDLKQGFIVPSVAVKFADNHSVGVSAVGLVQSFRAYGVGPFAGFSQDPANFSDRGDDWAFGVGFKVGYYGTFGDRVSIGAFYQSKVDAQKFDKYAGLFENGGDFDVPASWGVGASVKVSDRLTLGADFKRIEYSGVEAVGNSITRVFDGVPFGAVDGPGFGWRDISVIKTGAVWRASDTLTLRAGYGRSENPIPGGETLMNVFAPGVVQDHFTLGATVALSDKLELSAHAMRAPGNWVEGANSIPANFGGGEANIFLAETAFGAALGIKF